MSQLDEDIEKVEVMLRNPFIYHSNLSEYQEWQRIIKLARMGEMAKDLFAFDGSLLDKQVKDGE